MLVALHAPGFPAVGAVEALARSEVRFASGALVVGISREGAAVVNVRQAQRQRLRAVEALALAVGKVVVNDGPDAEVAVVAALGTVEAEVGDVGVAGDEEGVGRGEEGRGGGEEGEELHFFRIVL